MSLLPQVDPDTGHSISHYLNRYDDAESDAAVVEDELRLIEKENPAVAEFIGRWSTKEGKVLCRVAFCGILVYRLLRSQAESDLMDAEFKFK